MSKFKKSEIFILLIGAFAQLIFFLFTPICFECDALTYLNTSKALFFVGGVFDDYRPIFYPVFLALSGVIFPGTFVLVLIFQYIIGVLGILYYYKIIYLSNPHFAMLGALFLILSGVTLYSVKFILADHIYIFLLFISIFYLYRVHSNSLESNLHKFVIFSLLAMITRWESQFLLYLGILSIIIKYHNLNQLKKIFTVIIFIIIFLSSYSVIRSLYKNDINLIGTLQNGTSRQMFWRIYTIGFHNPFNISNETKKVLIKTTNGKYTEKLHEIVLKQTILHPEYIDEQKEPLGKIEVHSNRPNGDSLFFYLYGKYKDDPKALVDNMFNVDVDVGSSYYSFYIIRILQNELGIIESEKLLLKVVYESLISHPAILYDFLKYGFSLLGIGLEQAIQNLIYYFGNPKIIIDHSFHQLINKEIKTIYVVLDNNNYDNIPLYNEFINYISINKPEIFIKKIVFDNNNTPIVINSKSDIIISLLNNKNETEFENLLPSKYKTSLFKLIKPNSIYTEWGEYAYISTGFDLAGCATNGLNSWLMNEYKLDRNFYNNLEINTLNYFKDISSYLRNIIRVIFGTLFILVSIFFIFFRNSNGLFTFTLILYIWIQVLLIGILAGGANSRYDAGVLPLFILVDMVFLSQFFKGKINNKIL